LEAKKQKIVILFGVLFACAFTLIFASEETLNLASGQNASLSKASQEERIPQEFLNPPSSDSKNSPYVIARRDLLLITVWGNEDLRTEAVVGPDGNISFPLIGDILAEGLTISSLDNLITEKLKRYIRKPEVSVMIKEFAGKRVAILGEVISPGIYKLDSEDRILELVALAGGFTPDAVLSRVIIIRRKPEPLIILVTLNKAILKADPRQNLVLQADDIVYISKKLIANIKYFWDQVFGPAADQAIKTQDLTGPTAKW
jgi:polysaccharide export outer membrane protein